MSDLLEQFTEIGGIKPMKEKLNLIAEKAKRDKRFKFTSLIHHINEENLARCYKELKRDKACGIDNITVQEYGRNLEKTKDKKLQTATGQTGLYSEAGESGRKARFRAAYSRR